MSRFHLLNGRTRRLCLFVAVALTLVLTALPTAALAAPAAGNYGYGQNYGCGDCYVVRKGDTLSQIAKWFGINVWKLARYNGIDNPSKIYVGQWLRIPNSDCGGCGYDNGYNKGHNNDYGCGGCGNNDGYNKGHNNDYGCGGCGNNDGYNHNNNCGGCDNNGGYDHNSCGGCGNNDGQWHNDCGYCTNDQGNGHNGGCDYNGGCGYGDNGYDNGYGHGGYGHGGYGRDGYGDNYYIVRRGDTLSEIARHCGVSIHQLMYLNGISDPNQIYAGQVLMIG